MAKYSAAQLEKNRKSVAGVAVIGLAIALISYVASGFETQTLVGWLIVVALVLTPMWWLFASKKAGKIDGSWVDGWNDEGDFTGYGPPQLPHAYRPQRRRTIQPDAAAIEDSSDAVLRGDSACPVCGLEFGSASATAHVNCHND